MMMRFPRALALLLPIVLCSAPFAHGQRTTERFIPIGQSPGASRTLTMIGTIARAYPAERRIDVATPDAPASVRVPESTPIWIDRHALGLPTRNGSIYDCREGRVVEVKFVDPETRQVAEWVKLQAVEADALP